MPRRWFRMPRVAPQPRPRIWRPIHVAAAVLLCATAVLTGLPAGVARSEEPADPAAVAQRSGEAWLASIQLNDGGFAVAGLTGVETPEAVLALAAQAQRSDVWSHREAIDAIDAIGGRDGGPTALQELSRLGRSTTSPTDAALLITRVAMPLGLDPAAFNPANEGRSADLVAVLDEATDQAPVNALAEIVVAQVALGHEAPADLVAAIVDARLDDGSWPAAEGDQTDIDTTAMAITALIAAGSDPDDDRVAPGLAVLAAQQNPDGGWGAGGESSAMGTAAAMRALRSAGFDPDAGCWRQDLLDADAELPTPASWLISAQAEDGHWGDDGEALSTAVALQGLNGEWLPLVRAEDRTCGGGLDLPVPPVDPGLLVLAGIALVSGFGSIRILRDGSGGL